MLNKIVNGIEESCADAEEAAIRAEWAENLSNAPPAYIAQRQAAYPPLPDQLDAIWKGGDAEATMLQSIRDVKAKYPRE